MDIYRKIVLKNGIIPVHSDSGVKAMFFKLVNIQGGVTLINELLGTPKSSKRKSLIGKVLAEILEDLPSDVFVIIVDEEMYGEPVGSDTSENTWNWSQVEEYLQQQKQKFGF